MGNLLMVQERERLLSRILNTHGYRSLEGVRAFEAGCSTAYHLRLMVQWGARPEDQAGMDLSAEMVDYCRSHAPEIRVHQGSADAIPEPDARFHLALAFTLFSSVPDDATATGIASELFRITKPGGLILIHDMRRSNPKNPDVHAMREADIRRWFPSCRLRTHSMTLAPPLARRVGSRAAWLYGPLAALPPLRTHAMYVLRRPATAIN